MLNQMDSGLRGYFLSQKELMENRKPISVLAARDGYYELRENMIGVFCVKTPIVEQLDSCQEGFVMKLPKIPNDILDNILSFFRSYCKHGQNEVMAKIYWDTKEEHYFVVIPNQVVGTTMVDSQFDARLQQELDDNYNPKYILTMQIHSHNVMEAFWSETDNESETDTMIYAVVGNLDRFYPTIRTRVAVGGKFLEIPVITVFEEPFSKPVPEEWHSRVTVMKRGDE